MNNLNEILKEKGVSVYDLAYKVGVTPSTVYNWMSGRSTPRYDKVLKICEILKINTNELS